MHTGVSGQQRTVLCHSSTTRGQAISVTESDEQKTNRDRIFICVEDALAVSTLSVCESIITDKGKSNFVPRMGSVWSAACFSLFFYNSATVL
jgi:hypothetical protein